MLLTSLSLGVRISQKVILYRFLFCSNVDPQASKLLAVENSDQRDADCEKLMLMEEINARVAKRAPDASTTEGVSLVTPAAQPDIPRGTPAPATGSKSRDWDKMHKTSAKKYGPVHMGGTEDS